MKQISSDQIIDNSIADNAVKPIPRDLADVKSSSPKSDLSFTNSTGIPSDSASIPNSSTSPISISPPETPQLIGIKSQVVKIKEDGTYAIDVIIDVEDIRGVSDYEVRISKSAGNI